MALPGQRSASSTTAWGKHRHQLLLSSTAKAFWLQHRQVLATCFLAGWLPTAQRLWHSLFPPQTCPRTSSCVLGHAALPSWALAALQGRAPHCQQCWRVPVHTHTNTPAHVLCLTRAGTCCALGPAASCGAAPQQSERSSASLGSPRVEVLGLNQLGEGEMLLCIRRLLRRQSDPAGSVTCHSSSKGSEQHVRCP